MKKIGAIDIVGTKYTLFTYNKFEELNKDAQERDERYDMKKEDYHLDGYCDYQAKEIRIFMDEYTSREYLEMTLRHELTHAFLYEIGNSNHDNEEFVDKISKWTPQIMSLSNRGLELMKLASH